MCVGDNQDLGLSNGRIDCHPPYRVFQIFLCPAGHHSGFDQITNSRQNRQRANGNLSADFTRRTHLEKMVGKTEAGTIWLDPKRTSPYEFYQYWIRCDDRDAVNLLKRFTYLSMEQISELEKQVEEQPEKRQAQKVLAEEVTRLVHGDEQIDLAQKASRVLFGEEIAGLSDSVLASIFNDVPSSAVPREKLAQGLPLLDALCDSKLCNSRGEAKKLIKAGGAYVNNIRIGEIDHSLTLDSLASESTLVLRSGKKKYHLIRVGI